jgi:glycine cleavage system H protein
MQVPEELRYTEEHEWVRAGDQSVVRLGITDYAQDALGDVVFVQLPEVGKKVASGDTLAEVESTKSVAEVYAPAPGKIVAANEALATRPELVNQDPYGEGWFADLEIEDAAVLDSLLDAEGYRKLTE